MAMIRIGFMFVCDDEYISDYEEFDVSSDLEEYIESFMQEKLDKLNDRSDAGEEWTLDTRDIEEYDNDFADPDGFVDLDEYGEYVEKCEEYGEPYVLRYADIGDNNFSDEYQGCWESVKEFAEHILDNYYDVPVKVAAYIDIEKFARDLMMDYSEYDGRHGVHIFHD